MCNLAVWTIRAASADGLGRLAGGLGVLRAIVVGLGNGDKTTRLHGEHRKAEPTSGRDFSIERSSMRSGVAREVRHGATRPEGVGWCGSCLVTCRANSSSRSMNATDVVSTAGRAYVPASLRQTREDSIMSSHECRAVDTRRATSSSAADDATQSRDRASPTPTPWGHTNSRSTRLAPSAR